MGKFVNGLFVGIGIGLFIAPQTGEETRRMIVERVAAWRKRISSEDQRHFLIDARSPQVASLSAEPAQTATEFLSEPEVQETASVLVIEPTAAFFNEPEVLAITSTPPTEAPSTISDQNANVTGDLGNSADTAQTSSSMTDASFVPGVQPDLQTPTQTPGVDPAAITEELPPLSSPSNMPAKSARRKAATRTPGAGKSRGHNKS